MNITRFDNATYNVLVWNLHVTKTVHHVSLMR